MWLAGLVVTFGDPSPKEMLNVYGEVPPLGFAVKLTAVPTVPLEGPESVTVKGNGEIVMVADVLATTLFASVALTVTVYVPFTL